MRILIIFILLFVLTSCHQQSAQKPEPNTYQAIANRLAPFGIADTQAQIAADSIKIPVERNGKQTYDAVCYVCHASGSVGSPKFGCGRDWKPRAQKTMPVLLDHALNGFNFMPPRGGCLDCTNAEIAAAAKYMVDNSQTNETCK